MLEALKGYQISATVKELLDSHAQRLATWDGVGEFMQKQHRRKAKFVITQATTVQLLRQLRKAYRRRKSIPTWPNNDNKSAPDWPRNEGGHPQAF